MLPLPTASILLVLLSVLPLHITGQSNLINPTATPPANFRFALGAWFDNTNTPASFNAKLGRNLASFQAAQSIPYDVLANGTVWLDPPEWQRNYTWDVDRWDDATDASVFMTIYADKFSPDGSAGGMDLVSDDALEHLAARLHTITTKTERTVYLRWLPEFNGNWMPYGKRPKQFVQLWQRMATVMRSAAPGVLLVWSPNFDLARGDAAYWPGADVVDVVGVSLYYKGYGVNDAVNDEFVALTMHTVYAEYAEAYQKPFVISECSAGWEVGNGSNPSTGEHFTAPSNKVDQATMQSTFWGSILNPAFFARFPLLHGAYIFEFLKEFGFYGGRRKIFKRISVSRRTRLCGARL
ncbi:glycoside hydrolase superfamily [Chytriomyces sp. MP71]|nr:glycoside hydrolase superfamily [Chytriomyces sp. MP71]